MTRSLERRLLLQATVLVAAVLALAAGAVVLLLAAALAAVVFLRRALAPIAAMRERALRIQGAERSLDERLPGADVDDEFGRLAAALNAMLDRLARALDHERRFAGDVSHELRTPLANLIARAEVAREEAGGRLRDDLADIIAQGRRLHALVEKLLFLARADAGEAPFARRRVGAARLAEALAEGARGRFPGGPVAIEAVVEEGGAAAEVEADEALLALAVANLVDNAILHGGERGAPRLELVAGAAGLEARVVDRGPGIPAEALPHLFERFFRTEAARSRRSDGAGLGLAIVRWIVEAHGGRVDVASEPGVRTELRIAIPAAAPRAGGPRE